METTVCSTGQADADGNCPNEHDDLEYVSLLQSRTTFERKSYTLQRPEECPFTRTVNAAISGHNKQQLSGVTVSQCEEECCKASWCKSFDYHKNTHKCDLSDKDASDVGGLKTNYNGDPYDHYEKTPPPQAIDVCHPRLSPSSVGQALKPKHSAVEYI